MSALAVTLEQYEYDAAYTVAYRRAEQSANAPNKYGRQGKSLDEEIHAAAAEMAFAKVTGYYWGCHYGVGKIPDVGPYHIKHTCLHDGSLIVRQDNADGDTFVLVTGAYTEFVVRGYLTGWDAKQREFMRAPNGRDMAWFVPQDSLRPATDLVLPHMRSVA